MKKRLFAIFLMLLLCFPIVTKALATNSSYDNIKVYLFYKDDCKDCDKAQEWLEKELEEHKRVRPQLIKIDDNKDLYNKVKDVLDIKKEDEPLMIIGSNYFVGYNDRVKTNLMDAVKAYEDAKDYCDIVSKIEADKDTDECLKTNEGIYEAPVSVNVVVIIVIVLVLIAILSLISYILYTSKKRKYKSGLTK